MKKIIEEISEQITLLEAIRDDGGGLTPNQEDFLKVLYMCFDLIANSRAMREDRDNYTTLGDLADETLGEKPEDLVYKYNTSRNDIADLVLLSIDQEGIAGWIRDARAKLGMSKYQLAKELKISHTVIRFWEEGTNVPSFDKILQLYRLKQKKS